LVESHLKLNLPGEERREGCLDPGKASTNVGGKPSGVSPLLLALVSAAL